MSEQSAMEQVKSLSRLCELAIERKSIIANWPPSFKKCKPAAFVIGMQARMVQNMLDSGMYVYEKEEKICQNNQQL
jgi:hypothetical protein